MLNKYKARYDIFPINDSKNNQIKLINYFRENKLSNRVILNSSGNHVNSSLFAILSTFPKFPIMIKLNSYELVEIFLGNHPNYESLMDVNSDILCIYHGFGELPNNQLNNLIIHMCSKNFKYIIFYLKGKDNVVSSLNNLGFKEINLDSVLGEGKKEEEEWF